MQISFRNDLQLLAVHFSDDGVFQNEGKKLCKCTMTSVESSIRERLIIADVTLTKKIKVFHLNPIVLKEILGPFYKDFIRRSCLSDSFLLNGLTKNIINE